MPVQLIVPLRRGNLNDKGYINNKNLLDSLTEYRRLVNRWKRTSTTDLKPRVPEYVGECLYLINTRLSLRRNFVNYTYRDEMVGDGIENCLNAVDNFDPNKSKNPFGYFTLIAWRAFLRRISREEVQTYLKIKSFENLHVLDENGELQGGEGEGGIPIQQTIGTMFTDEFIRDFEKKILDGRKKKKRQNSK